MDLREYGQRRLEMKAGANPCSTLRTSKNKSENQFSLILLVTAGMGRAWPLFLGCRKVPCPCVLN